MARKNIDNPNLQVFKVNGSGVIFEVCGSTLHAGSIDKVKLGFVKYGEGNKKIDGVEIYLSPTRAKVFAFKILSENITKRCIRGAENAAKQGKAYPLAGYDFGFMGTHAKNGKPCISRQCKIALSGKTEEAKANSYVIQGFHGPGKENEKGLIVPEGKQNMISVKLALDDLIAVALEIQDLLLSDRVLERMAWKPVLLNSQQEGA
jgi:hypothetical protein